MTNAMPVAVMGKRKYQRVRDDNGEWMDTAQDIIERYRHLLYDDERDFDGLVKLLLKHAPTCLQAISKLPGRPAIT